MMETDQALPVTVAMRVYYSTYHLWAARHFARVAHDIEGAHDGRPKFDIKHRGYVTASIFSAVAFLEAAINELFQDAADAHASYVGPLDDRSIELLSGLWNESDGSSLSRWPCLDKYQAALLCCDKQGSDKGAHTYQDAKLATRLRNELVHFVPETRRANDLDKLAAALKGKGFGLNRLMNGSGNPFFPDHCLGAGCAQWVTESVRKFADEFFDKIRVVPNYQRVDFGPI